MWGMHTLISYSLVSKQFTTSILLKKIRYLNSELNVCNGFSCRNNYRLPEDVSFSGVFERNLPCSGTCAELESKFKFPLLLRNRLNMDRCVWFFLRNPSSVH